MIKGVLRIVLVILGALVANSCDTAHSGPPDPSRTDSKSEP